MHHRISRRAALALGASVLGGLAGCSVAGTATPTQPLPSAGSALPGGAGSVTTTPATAEPPRSVRIAVASDLHYGERGTPYQRYLDDFLIDVGRVHAAEALDAVVINGDIVHEPRWLASAASHLAGLPAPLWVGQGNHDGATAEQWQSTWGQDANQVKELSDAAFVFAATSDVRGRYGCADAGWLGAHLAELADRTDVFVFLHIPPAKWTKLDVACAGVQEVLAAAPNVRAVFVGHDHDRSQLERLDSGIPVYWDSHLGGHWGTPRRGYRLLERQPDGRWRTWLRAAGRDLAPHLVPGRGE